MKPYELNFGQQVAVSSELQRIAKQLEEELTRIAGTKVGFCVLTVGGHRVQYVSNCLRDDIKTMLAELLQQWADDLGPPHKAQ